MGGSGLKRGEGEARERERVEGRLESLDCMLTRVGLRLRLRLRFVFLKCGWVYIYIYIVLLCLLDIKW